MSHWLIQLVLIKQTCWKPHE